MLLRSVEHFLCELLGYSVFPVGLKPQLSFLMWRQLYLVELLDQLSRQGLPSSKIIAQNICQNREIPSPQSATKERYSATCCFLSNISSPNTFSLNGPLSQCIKIPR